MFDRDKFKEALINSKVIVVIIPGVGETEFSTQDVFEYIESLETNDVSKMIQNKIVANENLVKNAEAEIIKREQVIQSTLMMNDYLEGLLEKIKNKE